MKNNNSESPILLDVQGLCIHFNRYVGPEAGPKEVVKNLSLRIHRGEIVGLIGESGSGKTTLAQALMGLIPNTPGIVKGKALFEGKPMFPDISLYTQLKSNKIDKREAAFEKEQSRLLSNIAGKEIACIFQEPKSALDPYYTAGHQLIESILRSGKTEGNAEELGKSLLVKVGIADPNIVWKQYAHQLSGGMAQRVMIAIALSCKPKLLIADEPTTALDVTTQAKLLDLFQKLSESEEMSILLISHDIGVVQSISERVYVMHQGSLVESGKTSDILNTPKEVYTQSLVHSFNKLIVS